MSSITEKGQGHVSHSVGMKKRDDSSYEQVFAGTGTNLTARDGAIEGTAYLTYTLVSNATYDVDDCLAFCDRVQGCGTYQFLKAAFQVEQIQLSFRELVLRV